jgi:hypothetical protein
MKLKFLILVTILLIAGCGKRVETADESSGNPGMSSTGGTVIALCDRGLYFLYMYNRGGIVQVMDTTGKPMQCN